MTAAAAVPVCRECWEEFDIDSSPDLDCCMPCADALAWHDGATLLTAGQSSSGKGALVVAPFGLIVSAPTGREQQEG